MSYPIDVNIPAANNDPADDQPLIQQNFGNINSYLQVDHTNPAASGAGEHKQVTFNSNNTPAIPTSPPVLFTANDAFSTPQLFWYSGSAAKTSNQYARTTTSASGFLTGGLILKCGKFTAIGGGSNTVALTYAGADNPLQSFPNGTLAVIPTVSNTGIFAGISDGSLTASGFTLLKSSNSAVTVFFIAIGY